MDGRSTGAANGMPESTVRASMFTRLSTCSSSCSWASVSQQKSSSTGMSSVTSMTMLRLRLCRNQAPCSDCSASTSTRPRQGAVKYSRYGMGLPLCTRV